MTEPAPMFSRWFHRPRIHSPVTGKERRVGWLELFYDLVYVATFIQLGNALSENLTELGFTAVLGFAGLLLPIWLTWSAFTFYSNRFVVDDFTHRTLVFVQMFAVGAMAIAVPDVFEGRAATFALSYTVARVILLLLYVRAAVQVGRARDMTRRYAISHGAGALLWGISVFIAPPWMYLLWAVAAGIDLSLNVSRQGRELEGRYPTDVMHMAERYGLLIIIVLGESFVKVLTALATHESGWDDVLMGGIGLSITCCLWWLYFDDVAGGRIKARPAAKIVWVWTHFPLATAVTGAGVAIKKLVLTAPGDVVQAKYAWLLSGMLALAFASVTALDFVTERRSAEMSDRTRAWVRLSAAFVIIAVAALSGMLPSWAFFAMVAGVCLLEVLLDLTMAPLAPDPTHEHHAAMAWYAERARERLAELEADEADEAPAAPARPPRIDTSTAVRLGAPSELRRDFYFTFIEGGWTRLLGSFVVLYLIINVVFAALYMLDPASVTGLTDAGFLDAFSFSVQTMSTIGYGTMAPVGSYGHVLMTVQAVLGLLFAALATGLVFAKASRPRSSVLFSERVVVRMHDGVPTLMFRVGNARGNDIIEASMRAVALRDVISPEGERMRRLIDLKLERDTTPLFSLTWTVIHRIDESSPLHGLDATTIEDSLALMIATMTGYDSTYAQTTHARKLWYPEDFDFDARFVDVLSRLDDGRIVVDYEQFHTTEPCPPEPTGDAEDAPEDDEGPGA